MAVQEGDGRPRRRADRELARGLRGRHARRAGRRGRRRADRRRGRPPDPPLPGRARGAVALDDVERVVSHPQATAQCARFLRERLPDAERVSAPSTAEAVRTVCRVRRAAGGARLAPGRRALRLRRARRGRRGPPRQRDPLRLARAARTRSASPATPPKTSVVFWGFNDESPGALVDVLARVRRPRDQPDEDRVAAAAAGLGHYMFFADLEGARREPPVGEALEALARARRGAARARLLPDGRPWLH